MELFPNRKTFSNRALDIEVLLCGTFFVDDMMFFFLVHFLKKKKISNCML
jgi:hypothetical protein